jgi:predicted DNA-binding transcriptional regulator AlpA
MAAQIITTEDLYIFKQELLQELKELIINLPNQQKKWLKSPEVRKMLGISPGTLQNLRINGTLPYTKVGGVVYYAYDDILKVIERNKKNKLC